MENHGATVGGKTTRIYRIWRAMRNRCEDPKHDSYPSYGGRGVLICAEWTRSFIAFRTWANSTGYRDDLSIDRIDSYGDYEPANCRWATPLEQSRNQRESPHRMYADRDGRRETLHIWAQETGFAYQTLRKRYKRGIRGDALFAPLDPTKVRGRAAPRKTSPRIAP